MQRSTLLFVRTVFTVSGALVLAVSTVAAAPPALAGFPLGASKAQVLSRLATTADVATCMEGLDGLQHCSLRKSSGSPQQRLDVEGVTFSDWTFSFAGSRLVAISASNPTEAGAHLTVLARLAQAFGYPRIKQASSPDRSVTEARWRFGDGMTLTFHQVELTDSPLGSTALRVLRLAEDARD